MKDKVSSREILNEDEQVRSSYHAPQLISLGRIQSIVQAGVSPGNDGGTPTSSAS